MCHAVRYQFEGQEFEPYFISPRARLPVRMRNGQNLLVPWGRRPKEAGDCPYGPGIRLSAIQAGLWDHLLPKPVKIAGWRHCAADTALVTSIRPTTLSRL
jgi:hypothetical protein